MLSTIHLFLISQLIIIAYLLFAVANPVYSILLLILAFFNAATFLFLLNVEFLSLLFLIIYVGAIAILFLFIIIMLNLKEFRNKSELSLNFYLFLSSLFQIQLLLILSNLFLSNDMYISYIYSDIILDDFSHIVILGQLLFNYCNIWLLIAGFVLLISMVGAVSIIFLPTFAIRSEIVTKQLSRVDTLIYFY
jgi:NADH-quinone oxidoreductase subunit J